MYKRQMLLYGMNRGSMITIHSDKNREIAEEIMRTMNRGTTFYKSIGGYSGKECETLTCAVDRKQVYQVKAVSYTHLDLYKRQVMRMIISNGIIIYALTQAKGGDGRE